MDAHTIIIIITLHIVLIRLAQSNDAFIGASVIPILISSLLPSVFILLPSYICL